MEVGVAGARPPPSLARLVRVGPAQREAGVYKQGVEGGERHRVRGGRWGPPLEQGPRPRPRGLRASGGSPHQVPACSLLPRIRGGGEVTIWGKRVHHRYTACCSPLRPGDMAGGTQDRAPRVPTAHLGPPEDQRHFRLPLALVSPGTTTAISTWGGLYYH